VKLAIIVAVAKNRGIGKDGKLPWHISEDLKRFKRLTTGHTVLMGRRTWESLGKPLPNRRNVIVTSRYIPGVETYRSLEAALEALKGEEKVFVIGGAALFSPMLEQADELYLTRVNREVDADVFFPPFEHLLHGIFQLTSRDDRGEFAFEDYVRVS
jgi:dihydrofolate reductase